MTFILRQPPSGVVITGENNGDSIFWNAATQLWEVGPGGGGAVSSVFGRTGAVVAETGDYDSDQIDNISGVPGLTVSDALDALATYSALALQRGLVAYLVLNVSDGSVVVPTTATPEQMLALPALATDFALAGDGRFALGANAVITYTGPTVRVLLRQKINPFTAGVIAFMYGATAVNGDLIGTPANNTSLPLVQAGAGVMSLGSGSNGYVLVSSRLATLNDGDTVQPLLGLEELAGASDSELLFCDLEIWQVGNLS